MVRLMIYGFFIIFIMVLYYIYNFLNSLKNGHLECMPININKKSGLTYSFYDCLEDFGFALME